MELNRRFFSPLSSFPSSMRWASESFRSTADHETKLCLETIWNPAQLLLRCRFIPYGHYRCANVSPKKLKRQQQQQQQQKRKKQKINAMTHFFIMPFLSSMQWIHWSSRWQDKRLAAVSIILFLTHAWSWSAVHDSPVWEGGECVRMVQSGKLAANLLS